MKALIKYIVLIQILGFAISPNRVIAQTFNAVGGVSLSEDTIPPHASAVLDIRSVGRGVLVPRMTAGQRDAIDPKAEGLIVYVTDGTVGLYYYDGTDWKMLKSSKAYYPQGAIIMYSGEVCLDDTDSGCEFKSNGEGKEDTKMEGWQLCNGENGSPDLQDRFIAGIDYDSEDDQYNTYQRIENPDNDPGLPKHTYTMTTDQLPAHNHLVPEKFIEGYTYTHTHEFEVESHTHKIPVVDGNADYGTSHVNSSKRRKRTDFLVGLAWTHLSLDPKVTGSFTLPEGAIKITGGVNEIAEPIDNRPLYYVLAFLMRTDGEDVFKFELNSRPIKN
jgi:hypothetical protein